ncbi:sulfite exporter TauE/SafE family protein [Bacteroidota bacterium]
MSELLLVLVFLVIGFTAGVLIGMLGIGGGVLFVPTLYYFLPYIGIKESVVPYLAVSISLFAGTIASSFSSILHFRLNNIDNKKALFFSLGSCTAAFIAAIYVTSVDPKILQGIFAGVLFVIAGNMFINSHLVIKPGNKKSLNEMMLLFIGLFVGTMSAFTGLGGGIVFFPVLYYLYSMKPKKAIGTSSAITAVTMFSASLSFFLNRGEWLYDYELDKIVLLVAIPLGISALVGARMGVSLTIKLHSVLIKKIFSILLIIVVIKIIFGLW